MSLKEIEDNLKVLNKSFRNIKKISNPEVQKEIMRIVFLGNVKNLNKSVRKLLGITYTKKEIKPIPPKK